MNKQEYLLIVKEQEEKYNLITREYNCLYNSNYMLFGSNAEFLYLNNIYRDLSFQKNNKCFNAPTFPNETIQTDDDLSCFSSNIDDDTNYSLSDLFDKNCLNPKDFNIEEVYFSLDHDKGYDGDYCRFNLTFNFIKSATNPSFDSEMSEFIVKFNQWNDIDFPEFCSKIQNIIDKMKIVIGRLKKEDEIAGAKDMLRIWESKLKSNPALQTLKEIYEFEDKSNLSKDDKKTNKENRKLIIKQMIEALTNEIEEK